MFSPYKYNFVVLLIIVNIILQVSSFILVKFAAINSATYIDIFFNILYILAFILVLIRSVVWQLILKEKDLSEVYPINALVPLLILLSSYIIFNENISTNNILGSLLLMVGVFFIIDTKKV